MKRLDRLKKMQANLGWNVDLTWLKQFNNVDKLSFLNNTIRHMREHFDDDGYRAFMEWSYNDPVFNRQYRIWRQTGDKFDRPSLDHILPVSRGGTYDLDNLQWMSWFENNAKSHMTPVEFRKMIKRYFK